MESDEVAVLLWGTVVQQAGPQEVLEDGAPHCAPVAAAVVGLRSSVLDGRWGACGLAALVRDAREGGRAGGQVGACATERRGRTVKMAPPALGKGVSIQRVQRLTVPTF